MPEREENLSFNNNYLGIVNFNNNLTVFENKKTRLMLLMPERGEHY
jgi:hypothetical protein